MKKILFQVCTPQQGQRLKELGLRHKLSFFQYVFQNDEVFLGCQGAYHELKSIKSEGVHVLSGDVLRTNPYCAAYTVGELVEMLPSTIYDSSPFDFCLSKNEEGGGWSVFYAENGESESDTFKKKRVYEATAAEALASMLIWLLENNDCDASDADQRLKEARQ